jgi:energy-coupling factor transporter ATP-binding protein EcfA2
MAIEELAFEPGAITLIRGKNGRGKSSVANAIVAAFQGSKGSFVRDGETEAKIVVLLNNGTTIDRRIKREGKQPPPRIKPVNGPAVSSPAAWLEEQVDAMINPLDFIKRMHSLQIRG